MMSDGGDKGTNGHDGGGARTDTHTQTQTHTHTHTCVCVCSVEKLLLVVYP